MTNSNFKKHNVRVKNVGASERKRDRNCDYLKLSPVPRKLSLSCFLSDIQEGLWEQGGGAKNSIFVFVHV